VFDLFKTIASPAARLCKTTPHARGTMSRNTFPWTFTGLQATALILTVASASPTLAQQARSDLVVSVDWLAEHVEDTNLVLLHVGQEEDFAAEHIPGAQYVTLADVAAPEDHEAGTGLSLQMPEPQALVSALEALGISDDSRVIVYPGTDWVTASTRLLLTLDWIGLGSRSSLLDGGMQRWKDGGHPVTAEVATPAPGSLTPRVRKDLIVTAEWVHERLDDDGYRIIDARAPVHYDGIQPTYLHREAVRLGHIPGAANVPFNELWDDALLLKPETELRAIFEEAGVQPGQTVVGYCHLGQYATAMLLGARTLGYPVRLYDGSFQEWGSRDELPVDGPDGG
jgi:thiosulfate/3-mercaptopyruvate sulfurtransferase